MTAGASATAAECLKLTAYFGERDRTERGLLADELLDLYEAHQMQSSILLRGIEGFGRGHHVHTDRLLTLSEDLPVVSVAIDVASRVEALLADVQRIRRRGLITLERARLLVGETDPASLQVEPGEAAKLTVYVGRQERVGGEPAFVAVCDLLHRRGLDGANVLLGVDGTRLGRRERARFFAGNREVPMMILAVGDGRAIEASVASLKGLLREPLMTLERVRVCKRDGRLISVPHELPARDEHGRPLWQKLMIYSSERAQYEGHPLHRALVRRLRHSGLAGATSLRGIWGFHGDHPPHGDKVLQVRRHVPVVTIVVDTPERIAGAFGIVDELTNSSGLVTSEMVPRAH
jgi:PII-like signaling protein